MLGKRLRLAAAGLTDIGRRRERNQDNTTHRVPADEAELAKKGALFVVCDGMGGHAAGEVAAEIGVNTIRDAYFASTTPTSSTTSPTLYAPRTSASSSTRASTPS